MFFYLLQNGTCRTIEMLDRNIGQRRDATRAPIQARNGWRPHGRPLGQPAAPSKDRRFFVQTTRTTSGLLKGLIQEALQQVLEAEMEEVLQAEKGERTAGRLGYRSAHYGRTLVTRVGKIELRVPQDRQGRFRTEVFERYQRSEKALVTALMEMYLQGVSTHKVKAVTEELCGHELRSATISRMVQTLDEELDKFAQRRLEEPYPYLILDARYEKVREDGTVRSQAVLVAIGINWEGRRNVLAIELASRESASSWKELLLGLRKRSLNGVEFMVSDDHAGLRRAIQEVLPEAVWQRCYVHFLRNALDYLPRKADDDCLMELRWIYDRRTSRGGAARRGSLAGQMGQALSQAVQLGGGQHC